MGFKNGMEVIFIVEPSHRKRTSRFKKNPGSALGIIYEEVKSLSESYVRAIEALDAKAATFSGLRP